MSVLLIKNDDDDSWQTHFDYVMLPCVTYFTTIIVKRKRMLMSALKSVVSNVKLERLFAVPCPSRCLQSCDSVIIRLIKLTDI